MYSYSLLKGRVFSSDTRLYWDLTYCNRNADTVQQLSPVLIKLCTIWWADLWIETRVWKRFMQNKEDNERVLFKYCEWFISQLGWLRSSNVHQNTSTVHCAVYKVGKFYFLKRRMSKYARYLAGKMYPKQVKQEKKCFQFFGSNVVF